MQETDDKQLNQIKRYFLLSCGLMQETDDKQQEWDEKHGTAVVV